MIVTGSASNVLRKQRYFYVLWMIGLFTTLAVHSGEAVIVTFFSFSISGFYMEWELQ